MTANHDLERRLADYYETEAAPAAPAWVLADALATIDSTPQRRVFIRVPWRKFPTMNTYARLAVAAVAVVVVLLVGSRLLGSPGNTGSGGPSSTPEATATAEATATPEPTPTAPEPTPGPLGEGPFVLVYEQLFGVRTTVTIPAPDWHGEQYYTGLDKHGMAGPPQGARLVVFGGDMVVYGDPCAWESTRPDEPPASLDEFVAALSAQASRDASPPVDVTVGGYPGKMLTLQVPEDAVFSDCDGGEFRTLLEVSSSGDEAAHFQQAPGQISEVWVVDVDGTLVFFDAGYFADTPVEDVEEMRAMVESATFELR